MKTIIKLSLKSRIYNSQDRDVNAKTEIKLENSIPSQRHQPNFDGSRGQTAGRCLFFKGFSALFLFQEFYSCDDRRRIIDTWRGQQIG